MKEVQKAYEYGKNENGHYRKWPDGTLECFGCITINDLIMSSWSFGYISDRITFDYPYKFVEIPSLSCSSTGAGSSCIYYDQTKSMEYVMVKVFDTSPDRYDRVINWHSIGRWK